MCNEIINTFENRGGGYKDYSISLIRAFATLSIIACHIMQYFNCYAAKWVNVGVQIFFCISGFLYADKNIGNQIDFYKKRALKLLIPYYIVFMIAVILQLLFASEYLKIEEVLGGLVLYKRISGGGHLWFVPVILFAYLILPLLQQINSRYVYDKKHFVIVLLAELLMFSIYAEVFTNFYNPSWICNFIIGYAIGIDWSKNYIKKNAVILVFGIIAFVFNGMHLIVDYVVYSFQGILLIIYNYIFDYSHVALGCFLFCGLKELFDRRIINQKLCLFHHILNVFDEYSYNVFLVHMFVIMGPFSLMEITSSIMCNIIIALVCIVMLSWLLRKITNLLYLAFGIQA